MAWYNPFSWGDRPVSRRRSVYDPRFRELQKRIEDLRLATQGTEAIGKKPAVQNASLANLRRQQPATLDLARYNTARGLYDDGAYVGPQHNLVEIAKALDTESFFARAVQRHRELILKNGFRIIGRDPERVSFIKRRLWEIAMTTEQTTEDMFRELVTNLVAFSNHFLVMKRDEVRSSGGRYKWKGRITLPLSGLYSADPTTMSVKQSASGLPVKWRQRPHNSSVFGLTSGKAEKHYDHRDVIHLTLDKRSGWIFGTPYVVPVLDDIRLLRRLEELADIIAHKHAFPVFIGKVGTPEHPAHDLEVNGTTISEVTLFKDQIEQMEFEGGLVVTERHTIEMIGAEGKALDISPYLAHVERRVLGGLRLSEIDLGRGGSANRNTAQTITQTLIDACTEIQRVVEDTVNWKLFFFLLQEGGFNVRGDRLEEDMVYLDFPPIDTEERRAQENHEMALYQGGMTDTDEARLRIGLDPIKPEQDERLWLHRHEIPLIEAKADADVRVAKAKGTVSGKAKTKTSASKNSTTNKNRPANQFGVSPAAPRIALNARDQLVYDYMTLVARSWDEGSTIYYDAAEIANLYATGYRESSGLEGAPFAKMVDFCMKRSKNILAEAIRRGTEALKVCDKDKPVQMQITRETAGTAIAGAARYAAVLAYGAGFVQGAVDSGKSGIMRMQGEDKKVLTFPADVGDVVYPTDEFCPELKILES